MKYNEELVGKVRSDEAQIKSLQEKIAEKKGTEDRKELFLVAHWQREIEKLNKKYEIK